MGNPILLNGQNSPLGIYETSTVQHHRIGTSGRLVDRHFRYARLTNATGIVSNNLAQAALPVANHTTQSGALSNLVDAAAGIAIGATNFRATLGGAVVANQYEEGFFKVESGTGLGQMYKIDKHEAGTTLVRFDLYGGQTVRTAIANGAVFSLIPSPWADVIIATGSVDSMAVGVPLVAVPAATTAAPVYCWLQTWGVCSVLIDTSNQVVSSGVKHSATAGSLAVAVENDIVQRIGVSMETITTDTIYATIFLQISM